eukprot:403344094
MLSKLTLISLFSLTLSQHIHNPLEEDQTALMVQDDLEDDLDDFSHQMLGWSVDMPCGQCINEGHMYCKTGVNSEELYYEPDTPQNAICCQSFDSCDAARNTSFTCSTRFGDVIGQKRVCPYISPRCGTLKKNIVLQNEGDKQVIRINSLPPGSTCMYKVKAICGNPQVRVDEYPEIKVEIKETDADWDATVDLPQEPQDSPSLVKTQNEEKLNIERRMLADSNFDNTPFRDQMDSNYGGQLGECKDKQVYLAITYDLSKGTQPRTFNFDVWNEKNFSNLGFSFYLLFIAFVIIISYTI